MSMLNYSATRIINQNPTAQVLKVVLPVLRLLQQITTNDIDIEALDELQ